MRFLLPLLVLFFPALTLGLDLLGGSPLSTAPPPNIYVQIDHPKPPNSLLLGTAGNGPYETNAWWQNFVLDNGDQPVSVLPYSLKATNDGMVATLPKKVLDNGYIRYSKQFKGFFVFQVVADKFIYHAFVDDWKFGAREGLGQRCVLRHDKLSVTMGWDGVEFPVVRGMAYVTAKYSYKTPVLSSIHAILKVNGDFNPNGKQFTGTRFVVELNNQQTWIFYASTSITFTVAGGKLTSTTAFSGSIRAAVATNDLYSQQILDSHSQRIPIGAELSADSHGDTAYLRFDFVTEGGGELLMLALPHHLDSLIGSNVLPIH